MIKICKISLLIFFSLFIFTAETKAYYTVQKGDTLWGISKKYKMGYADILTLNPQFTNPNLINIGDNVVIRSGDTASDLTDFAKILKSVTVYQYGGQNAPYKTDCSGWTQYIYKQFGVSLPRVSREQATVGTPIKFQDMIKGDLMFFSTREDKSITHVGIYLGGGYWISNLSTKQSVTTLSTKSTWTQNYFLWAQRVL